MAEFKTLKRDSAGDELAKIAAGVPKGFSGTVSTKKEVLTTLISDKHRELTKLEIEEEYFRHAKEAGTKIVTGNPSTEARDAQMGQLLQIAVAKVRETKNYLGWLCEQWEVLQ